jgi:hypothetical protein
MKKPERTGLIRWMSDRKQQKLYSEKSAMLDAAGERVEAFGFYRALFPEGSFERLGHPEDNRPNGIAVKIGKNGKAMRMTMTDDLELVRELDGDSGFVISSPIGYFGKRRAAKFASEMFALTFDLDDVGIEQLENVLHQMGNGIMPRATYIVNSGTGLHLYYQFETPIPMKPYNQQVMKRLKDGLTEVVWNTWTSERGEEPESQGIMQGFRMVGTASKLGGKYPVAAWKFGEPVTFEHLRHYAKEKVGNNTRTLEEIGVSLQYEPELSLDEAKKKYPSWYERRIVRGEPKGRWTAKRDLYDWWKREMDTKIVVGHRYFAVMTLAVYAVKCGIGEDELRRDAYSFLDDYDSFSPRGNRFTKDDIEAALSAYLESYTTFPRAEIARLTGVTIPKNKRNGRPQLEHLKIARFARDINHPDGSWRGRKSKAGTVREYFRAHPDATNYRAAKDLGLHQSTVAKHRPVKRTP